MFGASLPLRSCRQIFYWDSLCLVINQTHLEQLFLQLLSHQVEAYYFGIFYRLALPSFILHSIQQVYEFNLAQMKQSLRQKICIYLTKQYKQMHPFIKPHFHQCSFFVHKQQEAQMPHAKLFPMSPLTFCLHALKKRKDEQQIDVRRMELQTCKNICKQLRLINEEQQQQNFALNILKNKHITTKQPQPISNTNNNHKDVFSFKLNEYRPFAFSDKIASNHSQATPTTRERSNSQITPSIFHSSTAQRNIYNSPPSRISKIHYSSQQSVIGSNHQGTYHQYEKMSQQSKPSISFRYTPFDASSTKPNTFKRMRTVQQQTQYSSGQSQILFKSHFEIPQTSSTWVSFKKKKDNQKQTIQQPSQQQLNNDSLRSISECITSQQQSYLPHLDLYNGRTLQTIVTSTQIRSRNSSRLQNQLGLLKQTKQFQKLRFRSANQPQVSLAVSPRQQLSPQINRGVTIDPSYFYQHKEDQSQKVSVLSLPRESDVREDEDELRDVIDHNFLTSQPCSKTNSPKVSLNPSLKNFSQNNDPAEKKQKLVHSRQNSWQLGLLMARMRRTNTIQSIQSYSSEMISCLDIKFMKRVRERRGVSRLI